ncbi:MAG: putative alpha/beta superfamily hydrolase [Cellvibrionaceae bacterium]|jgi:predicted alpha/beta superfamily hydrolase
MQIFNNKPQRTFYYLIINLFLYLLLSGCGGGGGGSALTGQVEPNVLLRGDHNNVNYPIMVYLPKDYEIDTNIKYPLLLILDAEWNFKPIINIVDELEKDIIVVGVGNANANTGAYQRGIDYTWPGAEKYYNFLTLQVLPYIEASYSINANDRTLSGHSFGGLFTGIAMLIEPPNGRYFNKYLSQDGSFWKDPSIINTLEDQLYSIDQSLPIQLILTGATGYEGNATVVRRFYNQLVNRDYSDLDIIYLQNGVDHIGDIVVSMPEALDLLYPEP